MCGPFSRGNTDFEIPNKQTNIKIMHKFRLIQSGFLPTKSNRIHGISLFKYGCKLLQDCMIYVEKLSVRHKSWESWRFFLAKFDHFLKEIHDF